jgi:hypothetical protein
MILDGEGRVIFRQAGLDYEMFVETLESRLREEVNRTDSARK